MLDCRVSLGTWCLWGLGLGSPSVLWGSRAPALNEPSHRGVPGPQPSLEMHSILASVQEARGSIISHLGSQMNPGWSSTGARQWDS